MPRPIVLIHGYSADSHDFSAFKKALQDRGMNAKDINICDYVSLSNEVTVKDIAEGLDRAFKLQADLNPWDEFDAIVHSTGMLVIRSWLTAYGPDIDRTRIKRLKHLVGLAPATWGSPQAHKGRSFLGALVKGNRNLGPDFMEAGDRVLDALELGSRFTWDLAHADLLSKTASFDSGTETPWVAVFIGDQPYTGLPRAASDPGTDGTVRWAGCGLNTRKIGVDVTKPAGQFELSDWAVARQDIPLMPVPGKNHGTIVQEPDDAMADHIFKFLSVDSLDAFALWQGEWPVGNFGKMTETRQDDSGSLAGRMMSLINPFKGDPIDGWQQFIVFARDERGDSIPDYMIEIEGYEDGEWNRFEDMYEDVHPYSGDPGLRCFHIRLGKGLCGSAMPLRVKLTADTGTDMVGYKGYILRENEQPTEQIMTRKALTRGGEPKPFIIAFNNRLPNGGTFFFPFTTTLVELKLNREPLLENDPPLVRLRP